MRFLFGALVVAAIIIGILLLLKQSGDAPPPPHAAAVPLATPGSSGPVATYQPTPVPAPVYQTRPAASRPAPSSSSHRSAFEQAARAANVKIVKYSESGDRATITVNWGGDVASLGGDFLDEALRKGIMRDFDSGPMSNKSDRQGRRTWSATYTVKF